MISKKEAEHALEQLQECESSKKRGFWFVVADYIAESEQRERKAFEAGRELTRTVENKDGVYTYCWFEDYKKAEGGK